MLNYKQQIDEIAYQLYLEEIAFLQKKLQTHKEYFVNNKDNFKRFYYDANIKLRKDKINKINNIKN